MLNVLSWCPQGRTPADGSSYHEPVTQRTVGMSEVLGECVGYIKDHQCLSPVGVAKPRSWSEGRQSLLLLPLV